MRRGNIDRNTKGTFTLILAERRKATLPGIKVNVPLDFLGPLGFEPRTKGFTWPRRFRRARTISSPAAVPAAWGAGRSCLSSRALEALR